MAVVLALLGCSFIAGPPTGGAVTHPRGPTPSRYQYGINTYVTYNCQGVALYDKWAANEMAQYRALGANAVALAFPLYTPSLTSNTVSARLICNNPRYQSPTPSLLASVVAIAHAAGLKVLLRPLIDEQTLFHESPKDWRGILEPSKLSLWFGDYWKAIRPFIVMAQSGHVDSLAIASELDSISAAKQWSVIIDRAKAIYKGSMSFDYSWDIPSTKTWKPGTSLAIDAYPQIADGSIAQTPAQLLGQWNRLLHGNRDYAIPHIAEVVIDEIGIPAQVGAYLRPSVGALPRAGHPFNQSVQVRWFTAACAFMKQHGLRGIYYWGPWMGSRGGSLLTSPDPAHPTNIQPAARAAIRRCFT